MVISKITAENWSPRINRWHVNKDFMVPKVLEIPTYRKLSKIFTLRVWLSKKR